MIARSVPAVLQGMNKVATSVQLRFDVLRTESLPPEVKERLVKLAGSRMSGEGVLIIEAKRYRTQEQNRLDAIQRLVALIQKALVQPKVRKATRPGAMARAARVGAKKKRSEIKRTRRNVPEEWV